MMMSPITKQAIRNTMHRAIVSLSFEQRKYQDRQANNILLHTIQAMEIKIVATYLPLADELDITHLNKKLLACGYTLLVPHTSGGFVPRERHHILQQGCVISDQPVRQEVIDLIIVPGRAFDDTGRRIGRGGGRYDRILSTYPKTHTIGVGYNVQRYHTDLPQDLRDVVLDQVIFTSS